ncbi:hypothetical protein AB7459_17240 [Providencia rettgeri]
MDKSRQQFEEFISKGDYPWVKGIIPVMWMVWKASRESLINSLEPVGYITPVSGLLLRRKQKSFIQPEKTETNIPLYRLD